MNGHLPHQGTQVTTALRSASPADETATMTATSAPAGNVDSQHAVGSRDLEKSISLTGAERLRCLWYRLRLTVQEMNYASRRMVELQAPWINGDVTGPARDHK
jgi:hypothetical protein